MTTDHSGADSPGSGQSDDHAPNGRRSRAYVWAGSIVTAFIIAIVTTWGTGVGNELWSTVKGHHSPGGAPVEISMDLGGTSYGGIYIFAQKLNLGASDLRRLTSLYGASDGTQYDAWFQSRGGVDPGASSIKLVVKGNRTYPVQIIGMNVIKHCQQPLNGTLFFVPPAGAYNNIGVGFNLDNVTSTAQNYNWSRLSGDYFATHTISLEKGEVQTLQVTAVTAKQYCQFTLALTVVDDGSTIIESVTDHGQPFRVTAEVTKGKLNGGPGDLRYYRALYVGGVAPGPHNGFARENPATYNDE